MLKFLFGRRSRMVRMFEIVGVFLTILVIGDMTTRENMVLADYLYSLGILQYLFIRFCQLFPWYLGHRKKYPTPRGELGIEVHFLKSLVPASYTLCLGSFLFSAGIELTASLLMLLILIPVTGVNGILIAFHLRDHEPLPVNYFTHNWHLKEKTNE